MVSLAVEVEEKLMKFYSEKLDKVFDTTAELVAAETQADHKAEEEAKAAEKALISKEKKGYADAVKKAEDEVAKAQEEFNKVRKEAYEECRNKIREASKVLSEKQEARYEALKAFNEKYGPYTKTYTGENAYNEFKKAVDSFNDFFRYFW